MNIGSFRGRAAFVSSAGIGSSAVRPQPVFSNPRFASDSVCRKHLSVTSRRGVFQAAALRGVCMASAGSVSEVNQWPEAFLKHLGIWEGTYHKIDAKTLTTTDTHRCRVEVGVHGDKYAQRNVYTWDDGRVVEYVFSGYLENGQLKISGERLTGTAFVVQHDIIVFYAKLQNSPGDVVDTIRLLTPVKRARTWQVTSNDEVVELVHVEEEKRSSEDVYFDIVGSS